MPVARELVDGEREDGRAEEKEEEKEKRALYEHMHVIQWHRLQLYPGRA